MKNIIKYSLVLIAIISVSKVSFSQNFTEPVIINSNNYGAKLILNDNTAANKVPIEFRTNNIVKWEFGMRPISGGHDLALWNYNNGIYSSILWFSHDSKNIGIGTTNPTSHKLQIQGAGANNVFGLYAADKDKMLDVNTASSQPYLRLFKDGGTTIGIYLNSKGNSYFNGGNVGIGTTLATNPNNYKLAVAGTIGCGEIKVENVSTWSDFVFAPDYNLRSLSEVENFISKNKHLPDVLSEAQVKEQGFSLAEMDATLLQKIEELTLYTIEQEKKIEKLENENSEFKKETESHKNLENRIKKLETIINQLNK